MPSSCPRPHSSTQHSVAAGAPPRQPLQTCSAAASTAPPGQHYYFNHKSWHQIFQRCQRAYLAFGTRAVACWELRSAAGFYPASEPPRTDKGGRLGVQSKPGHLQLLCSILSSLSWPPSLFPFSFLHPLSKGCTCTALTTGTAQLIYSAGRPRAGQRDEQKENTFLFPINSPSTLCPRVPRSCPPTPRQAPGKGLSQGTGKAGAQPFPGGGGAATPPCPPTEPAHSPPHLR